MKRFFYYSSMTMSLSAFVMTMALANHFYPVNTFFNHKATIKTSFDICDASHGKYVFKLLQQSIYYPDSKQWMACNDNNAEINANQTFELYFDIAYHDDSLRIAKSCDLVFTNRGELTKAHRIVLLTDGGTKVESCYVYLG